MVQFFKDLENEKGWKLFEEMKSDGIQPDIVCYTQLIQVSCKAGQIKLAENLFRKMIESGIKPDSVIVVLILNWYINEKPLNKEKVDSLILQIKRLNIQPTLFIFTSLIKYYCRCGLMISAEKVLEEMKQANIQPDVIVFNAFIGVYARLSQIESMEKYLHRLNQSNIQADIRTCNFLLDGYLRIGNYEKAEQIVKMIQDLNLQPSDVTLQHQITMKNLEKKRLSL